MELTNSVFWLIAVVALGLPSAIVGVFVRRIEKRMDKTEKQRAERDQLRIEHEIMIVDLVFASLGLSEATAEAVQRIPDAQCNGDMTAALADAKAIKNKYRTLQREQTIKAVSH